MSQDRIALPKCSDASLVSFFQRLERDLGFEGPNLQVYGSTDTLTLEQYFKIIEEESHSVNIISYMSASKRSQRHQNSTNLIFNRGSIKMSPQGGLISIPSLHNDNIHVSPQYLEAPEAIRLNKIIADELFAVNTAPASEKEDDNLSALVTSHHEILAAQRSQITAISSEFTKTRIEMENEITQRRLKLQKEFDEYKRNNDLDLESEQKFIEGEKFKLNQRLAELDDRHNTHVRRQLRQDLKQRLASYKEKFELTKGTNRLRIPVLIWVLLIEFFCISLIGYFFHQGPVGGDIWDRLAAWLKSLGLTFFAVGTAVWYLKWLTQWSARHADAEFQLKQFELDIDRASWVVETAFEWKNTQETSIPQPLLDAISRNLFDGSDGRRDRLESPIDHLASALLGDASKLKIKIGDQEIELDRSAIKRASKPLPT